MIRHLFLSLPFIAVAPALSAPIYLTCPTGNTNGPDEITLDESQGIATSRTGSFAVVQYNARYTPSSVLLTPIGSGFRWTIDRANLSASREYYVCSGSRCLTQAAGNFQCNLNEPSRNRVF
jgi:hypothetical protein